MKKQIIKEVEINGGVWYLVYFRDDEGVILQSSAHRELADAQKAFETMIVQPSREIIKEENVPLTVETFMGGPAKTSLKDEEA